MSANRSWDIQPKRRTPARAPEPKPVAPAPRPVSRPQISAPRQAPPAERPKQARPQPSEPQRLPVTTKSIPARERQAPARQPAQQRGSLRDRRKKKRRVLRYVFLVLAVVVIIGAFVLAWRPGLRLTSVHASGPDAAAVEQIARVSLGGTYWHIIPRNSVLFYSKNRIRAAILDAEPDISAVSIHASSFSSLSVTSTQRAAAFMWCGTTVDTQYPGGRCFDADIEGLIFQPDAYTAQNVANATEASQASTTQATSTSRVATSAARGNGLVRVFAALEKDIPDSQSPIRLHVSNATAIPDALTFVGAMERLGAPVSALAIRGDEADLWLGAPTRITYVLGYEKDAANLAASVLPTLNLKDHSIQYVDLRFKDKAYVKRYDGN